MLRRLTRRSEFLFVREGAKARLATLMVEARRRGPDGGVGLGLTASRKAGNAVVRNRAKRRMREAARQLLPRFGLDGVDYVLVARPQTATADWAALLDDLGNALIRLRADIDRAPRAGAKRRASKPRPDASESD